MQIFNKARQYIALMRLGNPTGALLLYFPCVWGVALAEPYFNWSYFLLFLLGSIVMRSAGCIINDIFDKDFDKHVERTKNRPIASGKVSVTEAIMLVLILSLIGLFVLLQFNSLSIYIGFASIILVILYPLMKRYTFFPQAFLGLTFNYGILIGYASVQESTSLGAISAYFASIFWTIGYDTIYGFQDIKDDKIIGVKSTAIFCEKNPKFFIGSTYSIFIIFFAISIYLEKLHFSYISIIILMTIISHFIWQVTTLDTKSPRNCFTRFKSNILVGFVMLIFIISLTK